MVRVAVMGHVRNRGEMLLIVIMEWTEWMVIIPRNNEMNRQLRAIDAATVS